MDYPFLRVDLDKVRSNIRLMVDKFSDKIFRPHFKTHQSLFIGKIFKEFGVDKITVSSLRMAEYFAEDFKDITIAIPFNILDMERINLLSDEIVLNLLITDISQIDFLVKNSKRALNYFIEIDNGYHRTGIDYRDTRTIDKLVNSGNENVKFVGFLTHAGNTYGAKTIESVITISEDTNKIMFKLKEKYVNSIISIGDTPSASVVENFHGIDELRPGNFVFYDIMQKNIGVCDYSDISVWMEAPVISRSLERNEIVVHCGAVHLSKDFFERRGRKIFGTPFNLSDMTIIEKSYVKSLSQEHGIIYTENEEWLRNVKIGDLIGIYPVHSCLTADAIGEYIDKNGNLIDHMKGR
ncbi:MAG: alanine racemase [Candidatus Delongbacteria bacterium]|nr:alanine racemase [Candidatus Delongbacteria bacterium]MBN2834021.1 alanine racemase [Candidatus Delongbacteria bacterium]